MAARYRLRWSVFVLLAVSLAPPWAQQPPKPQPQAAPPPEAKYEPTATVMLPMQDGVKLATDYYLPKQGGPTFPAILVRTTYGRANAGDAKDLNLKGFAFVIQDTRGLGDSEGDRNVFVSDGWKEGLMDGADTAAWVKSQPWCNGKIGTEGGSALGITQVLLAPSTKDVTCQSIVVAPSNFYAQVTFQGGVWHKNLCEGWLTAMRLVPIIDYWKSSPSYGEMWTYYNVEDKADRITAAGLHVGGWYDIFQQGTINNFVTRQNHGGPGAKGNQRLIMRPAAHGDFPLNIPYKLPKNAGEVHVSQHQKAFFHHWLTGADNPITKMPPVLYYVMGDDTDPKAPGMVWRAADAWPPFPTTSTEYYLADGGLLTPQSPGTAATASFAYDPVNPMPTCGGANLLMASGPFDQRQTEANRTDLLRFATDPLTAPVEVTGQVKVRLFVSTDAPDTDFTAKLVDIFPPGDDREVLVLDGIQRVKYRDGFDKPAPLLTSDKEVVKVEVDLWSISWAFNTGHRIGLRVSSSNFPRFEKNSNTGDDFPQEGKLRVAKNAVHMGPERASALVLPVRPPDAQAPPAERLNP